MTDIICRNVKKTYYAGNRKIEVLRNVNLEVPSGSMVTIIGPSGSGKTTLLNIIGTIEFPEGGDVIVLGKNVTRLDKDTLSDLRNRFIGMMFQHDIFINSLNIFENILLPLSMRNDLDEDEKLKFEDRAIKLLKRLELEDRMQSLPIHLSGGEARRASLVRALFLKPKILLLDEPTANVDRENKDRIIGILKETKGDVTVIITTHDPELVKIADDAYSMNYGVLSPVS